MAADLASGKLYFNQKAEVLKLVMTRPPDRVTYGDLRVARAELDVLMRLALDAGIISHAVPYEKYVDESFIRNFKPVEIKISP